MSTAMWTATIRTQHTRDGLHFALDLTDAEWAVLEPLLLSASMIDGCQLGGSKNLAVSRRT